MSRALGWGASSVGWGCCLQEEACSGHSGVGVALEKKVGSGLVGTGEDVAVAAERASSVV